jgi:preprotein translocase subunit SecA
MGLTVGAVQSDMGVAAARAAYACDITYVTGQQVGGVERGAFVWGGAL